jgi:hypothetical protein
MSARPVQNVVNQVVVASSSSAAEASVAESSSLDIARELELELELLEADVAVVAGAAVPLFELQPATSIPPGGQHADPI